MAASGVHLLPPALPCQLSQGEWPLHASRIILSLYIGLQASRVAWRQTVAVYLRSLSRHAQGDVEQTTATMVGIMNNS